MSPSDGGRERVPRTPRETRRCWSSTRNGRAVADVRLARGGFLEHALSDPAGIVEGIRNFGDWPAGAERRAFKPAGVYNQRSAREEHACFGDAARSAACAALAVA